ncbi:MAG: FAD-binding protein [Alphaproteobacteria bacterium]|nr:FAD-binding protein [Alphaproteobacteria bacterium]
MPALMRRRESGGRVDRSRPIPFTFNGRPCTGLAGDTLASALLASDVAIIGRSLRHNRPRGVSGAFHADQGAYLKLQENSGSRIVLATEVDLCEGMAAESLLPWPPPTLLERLRRDQPKAPAADPVHAPMPPHFTSESGFAHCDVLVVGGGPAGLMTALTAGYAGARVILADDNASLGGSLLWCTAGIDGMTSDAWLADAEQALRSLPDVQIFNRSTVTGLDNRGHVIVLRAATGDAGPGSARQHWQVWKVIAKQVVLATGAIERPMVFPDNDLPGVMLTSGLLSYSHHFGLEPAGGPVAVVGNNDKTLELAARLHDDGVPVETVIDARREIRAEMIAAMCDRGINLFAGHVVTRVLGDTQVNGLEVNHLGDGRVDGERRRFDCRLIAASGGWNPRTDLLRQAGGSIVYNADCAAMVAGETGAVSHVAGSVTGNGALAFALQSGRDAGAAAARSAGFTGGEDITVPETDAQPGFPTTLPLWQVPQSGLSNRARQWVDLRRDMTISDHSSASRSPEETWLGGIADTLMTPPKPLVSFDFVTMNVDPKPEPVLRLLPAHPLYAGRDAAFRRTGGWLSPAYYPVDGVAAEETVMAEMGAVRAAAGMIDLSLLGRIEVSGDDSPEFLDWMYCTPMADLPTGTARYGRLLDDGGTVVDHGVVVRLEDTRFLVHTSPGNAEPVREWFESWLTSDLASLSVQVSPVTSAWATFAVAGPRARQVLLELDRDIDVSTAAFPFLALRTGTLCGAPVRIVRTGNVGEVCYEISVPANFGQPLAETLLSIGARFGLRPVGEIALSRLSAEKGRLDIPAVAPRSLTPFDLDPTGKWRPKQADFVGKNALARARSGPQDRLQLVALRSEDAAIVLPQSGVVAPLDGSADTRQGRIAISFDSDAVGQPVTLALLTNGHQRLGDTVRVVAKGGSVPARIVKPFVFDPSGRRRFG